MLLIDIKTVIKMTIIITFLSVVVVVFVIGTKIYSNVPETLKITITPNNRKVLSPIIGVVSVLTLFIIINFASEPGNTSDNYTANKNSVNVISVTRNLGGDNYKTVFDGEIIWMAEDLRLEISDSWCFNNGNACNNRLYTKHAAAQACWAIGYRLPTELEWKTVAHNLFDNLNGKQISFSSTLSYKILLSKSIYGFNAKLNGKGNIYDNKLIEFLEKRKRGYYWSEQFS